MALPALEITASFDRKHVQRGFAQLKMAGRNFAKNMKSVSSDFMRAGKIIGASALAMGAAISATVFKFAQAGQEVLKFSKVTGLSVTELSTLKNMVKITGANMKDFTELFANQSQAIDRANKGAERYTDAFKKLGLDTKKLAQLDTPEQFSMIAEALSSVDKASDRARIAIALFGEEQGKKLSPVLAEGVEGFKKMREEAQRTAWTDEQAKGANNLMRALNSLWANIASGVRAAIDFQAIADAIGWVRDQVVRFVESDSFKKIVEQVRNFTRETIVNLWEVANVVFKTAQVWGLLDKEIKDKLKSILVAVSAFAVAWKTGFVQLFASTAIAVVSTFAKMVGPAGILGILTALVGALVGFKLGNVLEKTFDFSGLLLKASETMKSFWKLVQEGSALIVQLAWATGRRIKQAITGQEIEPDLFKQIEEEANQNTIKIIENWEKAIDKINEQSSANGKTFAENFKEEFASLSPKKLMEKFKKGIKKGLGLDEIIKAFQVAFAKTKDLEKFKFSDAEEFKKNVRNAGDEIRSWTRPFRGMDRVLERSMKVAKQQAKFKDAGQLFAEARKPAMKRALQNIKVTLQKEKAMEQQKLADGIKKIGSKDDDMLRELKEISQNTKGSGTWG